MDEAPQILKFMNGDLVVAKLQTKETTYVLEDPVAVVPVQIVREDLVGETFVLKPWIGISTDTTYEIPMSCVMTLAKLRLSLLEQYTNFITGGGTTELPPEDEYDTENHEFDRLTAAILKTKNLLN